MKIAIDMSQILYGTGVSHYRRNLVKNLLSIDHENEYLLYGGSLRQIDELKKILLELSAGRKNSQVNTFPIPPTLSDIIWNRFHYFPIEKLIGKIDIVHTSDWSEPPSKAVKVTTIHDLIPLKFPKLTSKSVVEVHKRKLAWVFKESKQIIVPSNSTKNDLVDLGLEGDNITVIYESPNLVKSSNEAVSEIKKRLKIHEDYLVAIGLNPRKNIKNTIDAFRLSSAGKNLKLLVVGQNHAVAIKAERNVRFLGQLNDSDLAAVLTGSKGLVYPSFYEGLGIPILDAFSCGVPVVTSNNSGMLEAGGDAAVFVDPEDVSSIADGITTILSKPKTLISKGEKEVSKYSWQKTAEKTLRVYKKAQLN